MTDIKEEYHLKNLSGSDAKRILEIADQEDIDIEAIIDFINKLKGVKKEMNDKKNFTENELKIEEYQLKHPEVSYRDCVLAVLDRTEPEPKKEFTEEEKRAKEDNKAVEDYIKDHPGTSYKDAVRIALDREELTLEEKVVEEYIEKNNCSYREAVLAVLPLTKKEE